MDVEQLPIDNRLRDEPLWCRYAINTTGSHNKFYEVRIDLDPNGTFHITKHWGPRPWDSERGQTKLEVRGTYATAKACANDIFNKKVREGYSECERGT